MRIVTEPPGPQREETDPVGRPPRVVLAGAGYSSNLGDQAIRLAIQHRLGEAGQVTEYLDLGGRRVQAASNALESSGRTRARARLIAAVGHRSIPVQRLALLPPMLCSIARALPRWWRQIGRADHVVLGGGNILADEWLNFPIKVLIVGGLARARGVPLSVFAVGASPAPSRTGTLILKAALALARPQHISARENTAEAFMKSAHPAVPTVRVGDPALDFVHSLGLTRCRTSHRPCALIEITAPAFHSIATGVRSSDYEDAVVQVVLDIQSSGYEVVLTATGEQLDASFANGLRSRLPQVRLELPTTPLELALLAADADLMWGHRLHFNIFAAMLGVPIAVPHRCSAKLQDFLEQLAAHATRVMMPVAGRPAIETVTTSELWRTGVAADAAASIRGLITGGAR